MSRAVFEERFFGVLKWLSVAFFVFIAGFPLLYMVGLSFKPIQALLRDPGTIIPTWDEIVGLETYREVIIDQGFSNFIRNSLIVAVVAVIESVGLAIAGAYAAARLRFRGKNAASWGILIVYLFPAVVIAIPLFVLFSRIGLRSSLIGLIIVYLAQTVPVADQDYPAFRSLLETALTIDPDAAPSYRLVNLIMQERAAMLLERAEELFLVLDEEEP